jgi:hypothetical protein
MAIGWHHIIHECTMANLPASPRDNRPYLVTDAAQIGDTSTGSGSVRGLVFYDGSSWVWLHQDFIASISASLTIASGSITLPSGGPGITVFLVGVDTQDSDPTDDLTDISGGSNNDIVILRTVNDGRDVTLKHNGGTTATELWLTGQADFTLDTTRDRAVLIKRLASAGWSALSLSDN